MTMMSKSVKCIRNFIMSFFSGGQTLESPFQQSPMSKYIIWNNKDIKIDNKSIYYPNYVKAGILFCTICNLIKITFNLTTM